MGKGEARELPDLEPDAIDLASLFDRNRPLAGADPGGVPGSQMPKRTKADQPERSLQMRRQNAKQCLVGKSDRASCLGGVEGVHASRMGVRDRRWSNANGLPSCEEPLHRDVEVTTADRGLNLMVEMIAVGVWRQCDGTHARALRYSGSRFAAMTLVPAGCWIEAHGDDIHVCGERGEWTGTHRTDAIAICIAALQARLSDE